MNKAIDIIDYKINKTLMEMKKHKHIFDRKIVLPKHIIDPMELLLNGKRGDLMNVQKET